MMKKVISFFLILAIFLSFPLGASAEQTDGMGSPRGSSSLRGPSLFAVEDVPAKEILVSSISPPSPAFAIDNMKERIEADLGIIIEPDLTLVSSMVLTNDTDMFYVLTSPLLFNAFCESEGFTPEEIRAQIFENGFFFSCRVYLSSGEEIAFQPSTAVGLMQNVRYDSNNQLESELALSSEHIAFEPGESVTVDWEFSMPATVGNIFQGADHNYSFSLEVSQGGKTVVRYIDSNGNELLPAETLFGPIGEEYAIPEVQITGFELQRVEGSTMGVFSEEETEVVFVYAEVLNPEPPDPDNPVLPDPDTPGALDPTSPNLTTAPQPSGSSAGTLAKTEDRVASYPLALVTLCSLCAIGLYAFQQIRTTSEDKDLDSKLKSTDPL